MKSRQEVKHRGNIHQWLKYHYGRAVSCENPNCTSNFSKRFEYSLLKGKLYEKNRDNFWMLCPSCHRKYDDSLLVRDNKSKAQKRVVGHELKRRRSMLADFAKKREISVRQVSLQGVLIKTFDSISSACKDTGIDNATLGRALKNGRIQKGYRWKNV